MVKAWGDVPINTEPLLEVNLETLKRWSNRKELRLSFRKDVRLPTLFDRYAFPALRSRYRFAQGIHLPFRQKDYWLSLRFADNKVFPHRTLRGGLSLYRQNAPVVPNYESSGEFILESLAEKTARNEGVQGEFAFERLFFKFPGTLKIHLEGGTSRQEYFFEQLKRRMAGTFLRGNLSWKTGFNLPVNFFLGAGAAETRSRILETDDPPFRSRDLQFHFDLLYNSSPKLRLRWSNTLHRFRSGGDPATTFWTSSIKAHAPSRWKKLRFSLEIHNPLNQNQVVTLQDLGFLQIRNTRRLMERYLLVQGNISF